MADQNQKFLKRLSDYTEIPATDYLIEPYVPMGALIFVAGLPKTFKSFLSGIDWGYSFATGRKWLGRPTMKGRVAYFALEGFNGVLRRAEAWRLFYKLEKVDGDNLALITDRISFAPKVCSADAYLRKFKNEGFRPDLVIFDTWFKVTAGAGVGEQPDMSVALKNVREFQDRLTEWKVEDGLPEATVVVNAHTTYSGIKLFGSVTQFADCDVLYQLERVPHANEATLKCVDARDIEAPPAIMFGMEKVPIVTAKGKEFSLVISKEVPLREQPGDETRKTKRKDKKTSTDTVLDDLALKVLLGMFRGSHSWTKWSDWFEVAKAKRPNGLGDDTFNKTVKRLLAKEMVRKNWEGLYQVVLGEAPEPAPDASASTSVTSDFCILRNTEVSEVEVTSRSTSGSAQKSEVKPTDGSNGHGSVVPDKAQQALERLLNKKSPPSV